MEYFNIQTTQNVAIESRIASLGDRILAQILDNIFFFAYFVIIFLIINTLELYGDYIWYLILLPVLLYSVVLEYFFNGQTLGKMITKIRVVKADGREAGLVNYFLRWVFNLVDVMIFSGVVAIVTIAISSRNQRFGDMAANTVVIKDKGKVLLDHTIFADVPEEYQMTFPEVDKLTEDDIAVVKEVLRVLSRGYTENAIDLTKQTRHALEKKMGVKSELNAKKTLETVLRDYNYYYRGY